MRACVGRLSSTHSAATHNTMVTFSPVNVFLLCVSICLLILPKDRVRNTCQREKEKNIIKIDRLGSCCHYSCYCCCCCCCCSSQASARPSLWWRDSAEAQHRPKALQSPPRSPPRTKGWNKRKHTQAVSCWMNQSNLSSFPSPLSFARRLALTYTQLPPQVAAAAQLYFSLFFLLLFRSSWNRPLVLGFTSTAWMRKRDKQAKIHIFILLLWTGGAHLLALIAARKHTYARLWSQSQSRSTEEKNCVYERRRKYREREKKKRGESRADRSRDEGRDGVDKQTNKQTNK